MIYDIIIIGGGIVGMATALQIKERNEKLKVLVLEKEDVLAKHQTGNNSGVIHSGIYYKPGSLKALNCIRGYNQLIEFCNKEDIKYELCGKIIVATSEHEMIALNNIYERGIENGLQNLKRLKSKEELNEYEPYVNGIAGIVVPQTGIIDYTLVTNKYAEVFKRKNGEIKLGEKVINIKNKLTTSEIITQNTTYEAKIIINCAGLNCDEIAAMNKHKIDFRIIPFRGEYFEMKPEKNYLVKNLIYPVPDPSFPFLGVHFTRMVNGGIEAGPNAVFALKKEGYKKTDFVLGDVARSLSWKGFQKVMFKYWKTGLGEYYRSFSKTAFTKALQKLIPSIKENDLIPGGAGVRAQACDRNGGLIDDFLILEDQYIINVGNAPSPAATSSLSIGQTIAEMAIKRFN